MIAYHYIFDLKTNSKTLDINKMFTIHCITMSLKGPEILKTIEDQETRRALIKSKYAEFKACQDPVQKAKLKEELDRIHTNRLMHMRQQALTHQLTEK